VWPNQQATVGEQTFKRSTGAELAGAHRMRAISGLSVEKLFLLPGVLNAKAKD